MQIDLSSYKKGSFGYENTPEQIYLYFYNIFDGVAIKESLRHN